MSWQLVDDAVGLAHLLEEVGRESLLAIDTEAASFHRFHDRIYLIQLSTPTLTAVIDPLGVGELAALGELLANPAITKIFHDGDYDLRLFDKTLAIHAHNLFDTRIAAQFAGEPGIGLAALLEKYFGIRPDKRFQRADWSLRPLSQGMLEYAAGDTSHLHLLRDLLRDRLQELGRLTWAEEEFLRLEGVHWNLANVEEREPWFRLKGARDLDPRGIAILRELMLWREALASQLDRALFRVVGNEVLLHLAANPVTTPAELDEVRGLNHDLVARQGKEIIAAIQQALALAEAELPRFQRHKRPAPDPAFDRRMEKLKLRRNALAEELALPPGVLCPNGTLETIAREVPDSINRLAALPEVRQWQAEAIGDQLLETLSVAG